MAKFIEYNYKNNAQFLNVNHIELFQFNKNEILCYIHGDNNGASYVIAEKDLITPPTIYTLKKYLHNL